MRPIALLSRLWPHRLTGQVLLTLALALLLVQAFSAVLISRAQDGRRHEALVHSAALRLVMAARAPGVPPPMLPMAPVANPADVARGPRATRQAIFAPQPGDRRLAGDEREIAAILGDEGISASQLIVVSRAASADAVSQAWVQRRKALFRHAPRAISDSIAVAGLQLQPGGPWLVARVFAPPRDPGWLQSLLIQTLLIYGVLVGAIALILRHITRPLALLTRRVESFAETRKAAAPLSPAGPQDVRQLIVAHNTMEQRIMALLDEKDVMLGAIGHDLKTPLAALRVRIETVEDEGERARMAATIDDIAQSLDDILNLARVGRPADPPESTELSALVASVVEEYEDMGEAVTLGETMRVALPLRATWLRRALRNLIGNALRYGGAARVSIAREEGHPFSQWVAIRIEDDGPGIPQADMARMMTPFTRGEPSRNSGTGGAGLGLTLALAIAEQHGGTIVLANRKAGGLTAILRLPPGA